MFLLSLLTNKDSYNTQIIQCVNDTIFTKRFRVPGFGTRSGTLEPVPWNRFLCQITNLWAMILVSTGQ